MVELKTLYSWSPSTLADFLKEDSEMYELALVLFEEAFKNYCDEYCAEQVLSPTRKKALFMEYIEERTPDEIFTFHDLVQMFIEKHQIKAVFYECYLGDFADFYTIHIAQVVPQNKTDIKELLEVYLKETSGTESVAEVLVDKLLPDA